MDLPLEISAVDSAALLGADPAVQLIDVRTDAEYMVARIDGVLLVNNAESMAKVLAWPKETRILVHCHHGIRSLDAVACGASMESVWTDSIERLLFVINVLRRHSNVQY